MRKRRCFALGLALAILTAAFIICCPEYRKSFLNTIDVSEDTAEPVFTTEEPIPFESASPDAVVTNENVVPTTISGGMVIKNTTAYTVDVSELLSQGCPIRLQKDAPQILIIHTHSTEAYTQAGLDRYEESGDCRTLDGNYSVIRIGNELQEIFESFGLRVIHDTGVYDYPSYTGSYTRSGEKVEQYLKDNPSIAVVIDLHRDALGSSDVTYKIVAKESGVCASQIMIFIGSDGSGLEHPNWQHNLRLGLYLQKAVTDKYPSLMRPVQLVNSRYNQHLCAGSMILEVGSNGNTLQEALAAIRLFGNAAGPALAELIE